MDGEDKLLVFLLEDVTAKSGSFALTVGFTSIFTPSPQKCRLSMIRLSFLFLVYGTSSLSTVSLSEFSLCKVNFSQKILNEKFPK
jgi:hypothetical protein